MLPTRKPVTIVVAAWSKSESSISPLPIICVKRSCPASPKASYVLVTKFSFASCLKNNVGLFFIVATHPPAGFNAACIVLPTIAVEAPIAAVPMPAIPDKPRAVNPSTPRANNSLFASYAFPIPSAADKAIKPPGPPNKLMAIEPSKLPVA